MKNSEYWKKRFELLEQSQNQQGIQCYADIERQYRQVQKQIEGQIAAWYQRFAKNNGITLADTRKMLTSKELEELKWDINQYIQYGEENAINGTWVKQLENASARYHISRLEALKLQTQQSIEAMFGNQLDSIDSAMRNIYTSGYYRTAFEIQKGVGVGWDFATLDEKQISKIINKPWAVDGKNFSERIWGNRQKLVNELNTELTRNVILGQDPQKAIDAIARKMNTSKNVAGRLVMTEEAFFSSAAQKDCFAELDVEQFEIVATLDSHTSDICREMDGKHFLMSQWEVGVTAPPFHVWCRSTTVPFFDDEFDSVGERAARGEDGKTYFVPADMTYKEWEKSFLTGDDKSGLQEIPADDTIKVDETKVETVQEVQTPEPVSEHIEYKEPVHADYVRLLHGSQKAVSLDDRMQIAKHEKPDGSQNGGYVATTNYSTINSNMRNDGYSGNQLDDDDRKTIESLRTAISTYELDDDFIMTRYVNADYLSEVFGITGSYNKRDIPSKLVNSFVNVANPYVVKTEIPRITEELQALIGECITEKAFISTSVIPTKNIMKDKAVLFRIQAKKGTHCYIPVNRKESECIFADNSKLYIRDVQWDDQSRKWVITAEIE